MPRLQAETVYLVLAGVFGLAFAVTTPPFQSPDEGNHFLRAYQLSQLDIIGEKRNGTSGGMLPSAVFAESHVFDNLMFRRDVRVPAASVVDRLRHSPRLGSTEMGPAEFAVFPNTVRYSPMPYLPHLLAVWIARALGLTLIACLYLCRLFGLAVSVGFTWVAIRLLPGALKWSLAALALLPMGLFMAAMASPDAFVISLSFLTFALAVWLRANPQVPVTRPAIAWAIAGCIAGLALSKLAYFLVPAAIAIGLFNRVPTTSKKALLLFGVIGIALTLDLGWQALVEPIRTPPRQDPGLDSAAQLRLILHDPMVFVNAAAFDVSRRALHYYDSFIGKLGYLDVWLPRWVLTTFTATLVLFGVTRGGRESAPRFTLPEKGLLLMIAVVTGVMVMVLQYLDWVNVGGLDLRGALQGRYVYPVAPALLVAAPRLPLPDRWTQYRPHVVVAVYGILLTITVATLVTRYYS
jgi:uncharacterized membrane protein